jgi:hypothetical protein
MKFTLYISRRDLPLVPPAYINSHPMDGSDMSVDQARMIASTCLEQYINNFSLRGPSVIKARSEVAALQPNHFVDLDDIHIELRMESEVVGHA